jgi:hypothetical protein
MATLHIEHPVTDFATWRAAFSRFDNARTQGGVTAVRVYRAADDDHYLVVDLDFDTLHEAQRFNHFLRTQIWSTPDNAPALAGSPVTRILRPESVTS